MIGRTMAFAALVAVPAASFLCSSRYLLFFCLFPIAAAAELNFRYLRNIILLSSAPILFLAWAMFTGNSATLLRSVRWIAALAAGSYFAGALGTAGIALVLRSMGPLFETLAETMENAGSAVRTAGETWRSQVDLPILQRVSVTLSISLTAEPDKSEAQRIKAVPVAVSVVSWLFLLGTVSGRLR